MKIIDNLFKTLGDENRLRIINLLRKEELCVCEIDPKFIEDNKLLYEYLIAKMDQNNKLIRDIEKLSLYKENGMSCDNIEDLNKIILK